MAQSNGQSIYEHANTRLLRDNRTYNLLFLDNNFEEISRLDITDIFINQAPEYLSASDEESNEKKLLTNLDIAFSYEVDWDSDNKEIENSIVNIQAVDLSIKENNYPFIKRDIISKLDKGVLHSLQILIEKMIDDNLLKVELS